MYQRFCRTTLSILSFIFILSAAPHAMAQSADLSISAIPANPSPLQQVTLRAQSFSVDLDQSVITWKYNNKIVSGGTGRTEIVVTAPAAGEVGIITATISGGILPGNASVTLRPASVDMLWEAADSYTPPFYKGKALLSTNGMVRVTAIPTATAPKNVVYRWSHNDEAQQAASGYNKSSFLFRNSELINEELVEVASESGLFQGNGSIRIIPRTPSVVAYQNTDGFINYANGSSGVITTNQPGTILHFEPYYFSVNGTVANELTFDMTNNGETLTGDPRPNELRLSRPEGGGQSQLRLSITPVSYRLQYVDRLFTILFN